MFKGFASVSSFPYAPASGIISAFIGSFAKECVMRKPLLGVLLVLALGVTVQAATTAYLTVVATKQGTFKGEINAKNRKDAIPVLKLDFEVDAPHDAASGLPSGKRMYKPLVITKEIDGSSPQFLTALSSNEVLKSVTLELVRANKGVGMAGEEATYYTIKLTNATVASIHQITQDNNGTSQVVEEISLAYQKIEVESPSAKTTAADSWQIAR
jgi:type VI secretion system secreted protein Hcp